jgi:hypothetical protein
MTEQKQTFQSRDDLAVIYRKDELMEWIVCLKIIHKAPNYLHDHKIICTYNKISVLIMGSLRIKIPKLWHSINDIANKLSSKQVPRIPIKNIQNIIIDAKLYHDMFIKSSVGACLFQCRL